MKNKRLRLFPPMLMLLAGSIASIMTFYFQYELKLALIILLSVLLIFYIFGLIIVAVISNFDRINQERRLAEEQEANEAEPDMENETFSGEIQEDSSLEEE